MKNGQSNISLVDAVLDIQKEGMDNYNRIFKEYTYEQAIALNSKYKKLEKVSKIPVAAAFCKENEEIPTFKGDEDYFKAQDFLALFYNSTFIGLYSFLESRLKDYCRYVETIYQKEYVRVKGNGYIEMDINYLASVLGKGFSKFKKFRNLNTYSSIRHSITHNNSSLIKHPSKPIKDQPYYCQIEKIEGITINDLGEIEINDSKFLNSFCDLMKDFLTLVSYEILKKRSEDVNSLLYKKYN